MNKLLKNQLESDLRKAAPFLELLEDFRWTLEQASSELQTDEMYSLINQINRYQKINFEIETSWIDQLKYLI